MLAVDETGPLAILQDVDGLNAGEALRLYPDEAEAIGRVLGQAFARIGSLRFEHPGLFADPALHPRPWADPSPVRQLSGYARDMIWNETAHAALGSEVQAGLWRLIEAQVPALDVLVGEAALVHADANPKNVMVRRTAHGWSLGAVLDWEFAFSGPALTDLGNLLRFERRDGSAYTAGVLAGWQAGGGPAPARYLDLARMLDLYSLLEFINRPDAALHAEVVALLGRQVAEGRL